jgi:multidrug efflux system outer membrane protein
MTITSASATRVLESGGSVPLADLRPAEELEYTAAVQIPQFEQQTQQQENGLRLLLGQSRAVGHMDPNALAPVPRDLPAGLPSRLLERRPDILRVRWRRRCDGSARRGRSWVRRWADRGVVRTAR